MPRLFGMAPLVDGHAFGSFSTVRYVTCSHWVGVMPIMRPVGAVGVRAVLATICAHGTRPMRADGLGQSRARTVSTTERLDIALSSRTGTRSWRLESHPNELKVRWIGRRVDLTSAIRGEKRQRRRR